MEKYWLSIPNKTLTITKAFEDALSKGNPAEYNFYLEITRAIPNLKVVRKTHRTPSKYKSKNGDTSRCNPYKNLTYKNMECFIGSLPHGELYAEEYNQIKNCASPLRPAPYSLVRDWFILQFPKYRSTPWIYMFEDVEVIKAADFLKSAA